MYKRQAFFFVAGVPTAAITDVAATPNVKMKIIEHGHLLPKIVEKNGPIYGEAVIKKGSYPNQEKDASMTAVWTIMAVNENFPEDLAYNLTKTMIEKREDLGQVHKEGLSVVAENQKTKLIGVPWHAGAIKYFKEKGLSID